MSKIGLDNKNADIEIVLPYNYRCNTIELVMCTFKNHFIKSLYSAYPDISMHLWED